MKTDENIEILVTFWNDSAKSLGSLISQKLRKWSWNFEKLKNKYSRNENRTSKNKKIV